MAYPVVVYLPLQAEGGDDSWAYWKRVPQSEEAEEQVEKEVIPAEVVTENITKFLQDPDVRARRVKPLYDGCPIEEINIYFVYDTNAIGELDSQLKSSGRQNVGVKDLSEGTFPLPLVIFIDLHDLSNDTAIPISEDLKRIVSLGQKVVYWLGKCGIRGITPLSSVRDQQPLFHTMSLCRFLNQLHLYQMNH
eukprot:jgi/Botrbrau1/1562/Bobra.0107s0049.1